MITSKRKSSDLREGAGEGPAQRAAVWGISGRPLMPSTRLGRATRSARLPESECSFTAIPDVAMRYRTARLAGHGPRWARWPVAVDARPRRPGRGTPGWGAQLVSQQRRRGTGWPRLTRLHAVLGGLAVLCVLAVAGGWAIAGHGSNASLSSSSAARGTPRPPLTETGDSPLATSATPQPTPLATPTPDNCTAAPHLCGYPDATNTGVPRSE